MTITEPGIYTGLLDADYRSDPCPKPSLTQSLAKILINESPLHCWYQCPRLNPDYQPDDDTRFDVGNVAHKLMIGRGKEITVLEGFADWRKDAAKEAREAAAKAGKIAVLGKTYARAARMMVEARAQLDLRKLHWMFDDRDGDGEVVLAWKETGAGGWCRQMVDWLDKEQTIFVDYKTTDMSVAPQNLGRMMVNAGWPIQAAMAARGLRALNRKPKAFYFVVQETFIPFALNVVEMSPEAMTMGAKQLDMAVTIWSHCMATNVWPGYPPEIVTPEYPGWAESAWLEREVKDAARKRMPNDDEMRSGNFTLWAG